MDSLEFLRKWSPNGPWNLTSIRVDRKGVQTKAFFPGDEEDLDFWLSTRNGVENCYFHVNTTRAPLTKKAEREDIYSVDWMHVDVDPRAGENLVEEQKRILHLFTDNLPRGVPRPTCVVYSGGGYQAFWRLLDPLIIDGSLEKAKAAARHNLQLERLFGGDNCHNVDRIMRLPWTINVPDAKKTKKGRLPVRAQVVFFNDLTYPITMFPAAPDVAMGGDAGFSGCMVQVSGNIERVADIVELTGAAGEPVPDRIKVICVQGRDPETPKPTDPSRSEWLFDAVCGLVRANVPDETIFAIITDPDYRISDSVLDKGANAERYAIRQIERAKEEAIDPWLRRLNEQYAVIGSVGGKCRVVREVDDPDLKRSKLDVQTFDDFRNFYLNQKIQVGVTQQQKPIFEPVGKWWLQHPQRRQYDRIVFSPGQDIKGAYNLWRGFAVEPREGDCSLFLSHLRDNLCGGDESLFDYLVSWMAYAVQHPGQQGEVAIAMQGKQGTGKSFFAQEFGALFGRHYVSVSSSKHLVGNFNSHLRDAVVVFADEAFFAGDKAHVGVLKALITEPTIQIELKGVDIESYRNCTHLIMASNEAHVIQATGDERRFLVLEVGEKAMQDSTYFAAIKGQQDTGGREALLQHLLSRDLRAFNVRNVPKTAALRCQQDLSLTVEQDWWLDKLHSGVVLEEHSEWCGTIAKSALVEDFVEHTRRWGNGRRGVQTSLGRFLRKMAPGIMSRRRWGIVEERLPSGALQQVERLSQFYDLPPLKTCRAVWTSIHGPRDWSEVEEVPEAF